MSKPDASSVFYVRAPDRLGVIVMRGDAADALEFCRQLHAYRDEIHVAPRYDNAPPVPERKRSPMPAKYPGRCSVCATAITVGAPIYYDGESRSAVHARCAP
jgi:hypothetical protein